MWRKTTEHTKKDCKKDCQRGSVGAAQQHSYPSCRRVRCHPASFYPTLPREPLKSIRRMRSVQDSVLPRGVGLRKPHISLLAIPHLLLFPPRRSRPFPSAAGVSFLAPQAFRRAPYACCRHLRCQVTPSHREVINNSPK